MFDKDNKFGFISNNELNNNGSNNNIISMDEFKKILKEYGLLVYSYSITYKIMGLNPSNYTDILPKSIMSGKKIRNNYYTKFHYNRFYHYGWS